jgi:hypothetical protein
MTSAILGAVIGHTEFLQLGNAMGYLLSPSRKRRQMLSQAIPSPRVMSSAVSATPSRDGRGSLRVLS